MRRKGFSAVRALCSLVRPHRGKLLTATVCLVLLACVNVAMPRVLGYVIDHILTFDEGDHHVLPSDRYRMLTHVLAVLFGIYLLRNLFFFLAKTKVIVVGERTAYELRQRLISHLHTLSVDFYQQNKPGRISARVMLDVQSVQQFIQEELANIMINVLMLVVAGAIMIHMDWLLALVALSVMPFQVLVYYLFRRPIAAYAREAKEHIADVSGDLIEQFGGVAAVQAAGVQDREQEKSSRSMRMGMRAQIKQSRYYILQKVAADLLVALGVIALFGVGGYSVIHKGMSIGYFMAFYIYIWMLYPRVLELVSQAGKFTRTATSLERVFEILLIEPRVRQMPSARPHAIERGSIEFRGVSFSFQNGKVLDDLSMTINPGEHVLITGPSGSGKSTAVNLIPRLYDPQEGRVLIDGMDVRDFTLSSLRSQIGVVLQDCFLFNDTVADNVRYVQPEASDEAVFEACCRACAHEFIVRLPRGYLTVIGEGGVQLSQGEQRRLMIARAILKKPKILILDEPLVSLDAEARTRATEGMASLFESCTVLTITHYPDELPHADKIIDIREGKATVRERVGDGARRR
jgi:subfamily B ATP-binding cassette protein MsbA